MYSMWGSKLLDNFNNEICDQIATESAFFFLRAAHQCQGVEDTARQEHEHVDGAVEQGDHHQHAAVVSEDGREIMKPGK